MIPEQWEEIKYFDPTVDNFGDSEKMDYELVLSLDAYRDFIKKPVIVHCGWENRDKGYHPKGKAVDCHAEGVSVFEQFLTAIRFKSFRGIGVYPWWNKPGLHLDTRYRGKHDPISLWGSIAPGEYVKLTRQFMFQTI